MSLFNYESTIHAPAPLVFDWHHDPSAIEKLTPPWEPVTVVGTPGCINENGSRTTLKISMFGIIPLYWVAEHPNYQPGHSFQDIQLSGPFTRWCHTHSVEPINEHSCKYIDRVEYKVPLGKLGEFFSRWFVRQKLKKMFSYRHQVVKEECEDLAAPRAIGVTAHDRSQ